jgi:hypothetical protein
MVNMIISAFTPTLDNACSFFRCHGVLSELHKITNEILEIRVFTEDFDIRQIKGSDLVFIMRPDTDSYATIIEGCQEYNIPVVVDYDDDFFNVPEYNPYVIERKKAKIPYKENTKKCLELANHVIVSTENIKREYLKYNKNITVVCNAFDDHCFTPAKEVSKRKIILWRGGNSHVKDLALFKDPITKLILGNTDYTFVFWSNDNQLPKWITDLKDKQKNIATHSPVSPFYYFSWLKDLNPFLTIVPLEDNSFNRSKSDLAKIEGVASGGLCLAPDWEEWTWNSDILYKYQGTEDFLDKANGIIQCHRDNQVSNDWSNDMNYLTNYKLLSMKNRKRLEIFGSLRHK